MTDEIYEAKIEGVYCNYDGFGFRLVWNSNIGFGQFDFTVEKNKPEKLWIDNECMSKDFIKEVLCKMVDDAILDCGE